MLTKIDQKFMDMARKLAIAVEPIASSKISAVLTVKSNVISIGHNERRTHPFQAKFSKNPDAIYLHAETSAICNALKVISEEELQRATLYVHRVKRPDNDKTKWINGLACPCAGCQRAIVTFGIKKVVYSTNTDEHEVWTRKNG